MKLDRLGLYGLDLQRLLKSVGNARRFLKDSRLYNSRLAGASPFDLKWGAIYPILTDFEGTAGTASGHYFHQDLWAARKIFAARPGQHMDIGSRIDGFVAHVLTFMPVTVVDIRPLQSDVAGLSFIEADATYLPGIPDGSVESLSCLHALEHFGLGRYGDPIDPMAWQKSLRSMIRILEPGGSFYLSVPIGRPVLRYNAHRIFSPQMILDHIDPLTLISFSAVGDDGRYHDDCRPEDFADARFACGLFEFEKPDLT